MIKRIFTIGFMLFSVLIALGGSPAKSFKPGELWLDNNGVHINAHGGGFLFHGGRYWWFGEHKVGGNLGNTAQVGVHCYSSKDLYNWKDEGIALAVSPEPQSPITKGSIIERPKVIYNPKTKKFVMWFHLELKDKGYSAAQYGVAVADKIQGPYRFLKAQRANPGVRALNDNGSIEGPYQRDLPGGQMSRDMTLFVDDDGKAYHIFSSEENQTTHVAELSDDFQSHTGRYVRIFPGRSMEAPAICKLGGKYYFIGSGCTGWAPNKARSGVADSIMGPWKELANPCVGEGADLTFGGQSTYIIPVHGRKDAYIFVADIWRPKDAIDGRHMFLPIRFTTEGMKIEWLDEWDLSYFDKKK